MESGEVSHDSSLLSSNSCYKDPCKYVAKVQCISCPRVICERHAFLVGRIVGGEYVYGCTALHVPELSQAEDLQRKKDAGI